MKGIQCDRCGKFYCCNRETIEGYKISGSEPNSQWGFSVDLCSRCYKELKKIVTERKKGNADNRKENHGD